MELDMERPREADESFEEIYRQLEQVVAGLEQGGLSLEEALARFEQGTHLAERCFWLLDQAELRVTRLLADEHLADEAESEP
ncbi:MAG: exodeoxyribonuclease VII small subunit [Chloroflexi bacterium]|nr:exodeoxyribonuclease VII small subunit [Chloroflexota bacterium]